MVQIREYLHIYDHFPVQYTNITVATDIYSQTSRSAGQSDRHFRSLISSTELQIARSPSSVSFSGQIAPVNC